MLASILDNSVVGFAGATTNKCAFSCIRVKVRLTTIVLQKSDWFRLIRGKIIIRTLLLAILVLYIGSITMVFKYFRFLLVIELFWYCSLNTFCFAIKLLFGAEIIVLFSDWISRIVPVCNWIYSIEAWMEDWFAVSIILLCFNVYSWI
mgnify:CR=1 FL=1